MNFANPLFLLWAIPLALLILLRERFAARWQATLVYSNLVRFAGVRTTWRVRYHWVPRACLYAGLGLAVIAMARPRSVLPGEVARARGIDILLALDTSGSMRALDFDPKDRMAMALSSTQKFIKARQNDRIGLVVFAGVPLLQCPLTLDYAALLDFLGQVQVGMTGTENTAIGTAIAAAANRLRHSDAKSKIIVLLTDGRSNSGEVDPITAAKAADALGIRIYTIGVGVHGQSVMPIDTPYGRQLVPIAEDLDEPALQEIADTTGGRYYRAASSKDFDKIFSEIDQLEKSDVKTPPSLEYEDRYRGWLALSLLLLAAGTLLPLTLWRSLP